MDAALKYSRGDSAGAPAKRPAYDPSHLHPLDEEARNHDDLSEGIDWDEIIASTQDDVEAGRYCVWDFQTDEEMSAALKFWMDSILEEVMHEAASTPAHNASSL